MRHDPDKYLPALAVGGGFSFENQIFKGLALGAPYVKMIGMARAPIAAAMVGKTIGRAIEQHELPVYVERFGYSKDQIFVTSATLRKELGNDLFETVPCGALGHLLREVSTRSAPVDGRCQKVYDRVYFA